MARTAIMREGSFPFQEYMSCASLNFLQVIVEGNRDALVGESSALSNVVAIDVNCAVPILGVTVQSSRGLYKHYFS